jgi:hypothetical protein
VDYGQWGDIDATEVARGTPLGRPRRKFTRVDDMLDVARDVPPGALS